MKTMGFDDLVLVAPLANVLRREETISAPAVPWTCCTARIVETLDEALDGGISHLCTPPP